MNGNRLKALREKKRKLQSEVADELGLNRVTYNRYENEEREPDNDTLSRIADYFGVSTDYLLGRVAEKKDLSIHEAMKSSPFVEFISGRLSKMADAGEKAFGSQDPFVVELRKFGDMNKEDRETLLSNGYSKVIEDNGTFILVPKKITPEMETRILDEIKNLPDDVQQAIIANLHIKKR